MNRLRQFIPRTLFHIRSAAFGTLLSSGTVVAFGKALQIALHAFLAAIIGARDFGALNMAISGSQILSTVILFGLPISATRTTSRYVVLRLWGELRGFLNFVSIYSIMIAISAGCLLVLLTVPPWAEAYRSILGLSALFLPVWVSAMMRVAVMRGLGLVTSALVPWEVVTPVLTFPLIWIVTPDGMWVAGLSYALAGIAAELLGLWWLVRHLPAEIRSVQPRLRRREWMETSAPLFGFHISQMILNRADIVFVGTFLGLREAGYYAIALRLSMAINILSRIVNSVAAPLFARSYHSGDKATMRRNARLMTGLSILAGLAGLVFFLVAGRWLIGLFGVEEIDLVLQVLLILAMGEAINLACSPAVQALVMTTYERMAMGLYAVAAVLLVAGFPFAAQFGLLPVAAWRSLIFAGAAVAAALVAHLRLRMAAPDKKTSTT